MADLKAALREGRQHNAPRAAVAGFMTAAQNADLVDVAYAVHECPVGPLVVAATRVGLVRLAFDPVDDVIIGLAADISPRVLSAPARLDVVRRQLDDYFAGDRTTFDLPVDMRLAGSAFRRAVLAAADRIPYGEIRTYAEVARSAGSPAAVRAVGSALGANPVCVVVPCHRVLRSDGAVGGYAGGSERKQFLLRLEQPVERVQNISGQQVIADPERVVGGDDRRS